MSHDHHAGHDHGSMMDHSGHAGHSEHGKMMDNNNMGTESGDMHMGHMGHMGGMAMSFYFGNHATILFDFWTISSDYGLIGSMIGICIMAVLYEGLKYYREHLFWSSYNDLQYRSVQMPTDKNSSDQAVPVIGEVIHKQPPSILSRMHAYQTFLHLIQMVLSYFLMLIFMTYNVYLCVAVVVGAGIGYFLFGWKKSVIVDVTEHCH